MHDICLNCKHPVIYHNPDCTDHRTKQSLMVQGGKGISSRFREKKAPPEGRASLEELLQIVAQVFRLDANELKRQRKGNSKAYALARRLFMHAAYIKLSYRQQEIATFLSIMHGVSEKVSVVGEEIETNRYTKESYEQILQHLAVPEIA